MAGDRPEPVDGAAAGAWIVPALDGDWGGRVKNLVPQIDDGYARIGLRQEADFRESEIFKGAWGDELVFAILADEWPPDP